MPEKNDKSYIAAIAALGVVLAASACSPDSREADLRHCVGAATSKAGSATLSREEAHDAVGAEAADCMKLLGYRHDMAGPKCVDDVDFNSFCYVRRRRV